MGGYYLFSFVDRLRDDLIPQLYSVQIDTDG